MRFVSRSVVTGFVNALAILIFLAQLPELINVPAAVYPMVIAGLVIIYGLPRLTRVVPSPLVAIVVLTAVACGLASRCRRWATRVNCRTHCRCFCCPISHGLWTR
jgi:MFS superfamily sulfate permease-like transporter